MTGPHTGDRPGEDLIYPLGRRCCGAPDSTACHQRGLCWMSGVHPDSPGYRTATPPADRTGDDAAAARLRRAEEAARDELHDGYLSTETAAERDAARAALSASPPVSETATRDDVALDEQVAEIVGNIVLASTQTAWEHLTITPRQWGRQAARELLEAGLLALGVGQPAAQPAAQPDQPADDGLRARIEALIAEWSEAESPRKRLPYAYGNAARRLRRALDGDGGDRG